MRRKTKKVAVPLRRRHDVLLADACPICATMMKEHRGRLTVPVNGEEIAVSNTPHLSCPRCGEVVLRFDQERQFSRRALEAYRRKHRLLSAEEVRILREQLGFTRAGLARLLRLRSKTIARWEAGRSVQSAALDAFLRMVRDVPGSLDYLRSHAA